MMMRSGGPKLPKKLKFYETKSRLKDPSIDSEHWPADYDQEAETN